MTFFEFVTGFVYIERSLYLINHREVDVDFVKGSGDFFWSIAQPAPTGAAPTERIALPEMRQNGKSQHPSAFGSGRKGQIKIKEAIEVK